MPSAARLVNPNLTGSLLADQEALRNDLQQAQELALDFQRQLAGKSNEYAQLKQVIEKSTQDLAHMQKHIEELRAERHRLANEAMRAVAFEAKLNRVTEERDRLKADLEVVRMAVEKKGDEMMSVLQNRDRRIAELVVEIVGLRRQLEDSRKPTISHPVPLSEDMTHQDVVVDASPAAPARAWSRTVR